MRIMRDLGFNLRIVHRDTDMNKLYANFVALDMPEEYVKRLAESPQITKIAHLVATLRQMVQWEDQPRLLVGFAPEAVQTHVEQKVPMGLQVERGTVYLGASLAKDTRSETPWRSSASHSPSDGFCRHTGQPKRISPSACIWLDAQEVLDKPGLISEILVLGCKCKTVNRVEEITEQLEAALARGTCDRNADASDRALGSAQPRVTALPADDQRLQGKWREDRRPASCRRQEVIDREREHRAQVLAVLAGTNAVVTPMVVLACALWVGLLAWANVRNAVRRSASCGPWARVPFGLPLCSSARRRCWAFAEV